LAGGSKVKLSLCMIVKNEEKNLDQCLGQVKNHIDDIIIIDTGSTDRTKETALKYTNKVYDFEWCDDFAKARNYSLSKAENDWVLVLDADEVITHFDKNSVANFIRSSDKVVGRIKRINPFEEGKEIKKYIERVNRLFNRKYFHYEGIIHEQLVAKDRSDYHTKPVDIEVDHIGYLNEVVSATNKLDRNIKLLIKAIQDNPEDSYLYYQLGKSYYKAKDYKKAADNFYKAITLCTNFQYEYAEDLIESYGYSLLQCQRYADAMELINYRHYYENSPDYHFIVGLIYMNNGYFEEAVKSFEKCIGLKEGKIEGINSYMPNYNIGVIYEVLGLKEQAVFYYKRCGQYPLAVERLNKIYG